MKPNINDLSNLSVLKKNLAELNVSAHAITTIENAIKNGLTIKKPSDLSILNLPTADLQLVEDNVRYGPAAPPDVRTFQYSFEPVGDEDYFFGYQFIITYSNHDGFTIAESFPIEDNRQIPVDLDLSDILDTDPLFYQVKTAAGDYTNIGIGGEPNGELIQIKKSDLKSVTIKVSVPTREEIINPPVNKSYRVKGKLISTTNDKTDGFQVMLMAALQNTAENAPDFFPVGFATTETNGYFVTGYLIFNHPDGAENVIAAKAVVSKDDKVWEQPIKLLDIPLPPPSEGPSKKMIPQRIIIVIGEDINEEKKEDCNCGCGDLNFFEKKVLEEFSYQTVVRTTEPSIIANVIEDEEEVDLDDIYGTGGKIKLSVFRKYQASINTVVNANPASAAVADTGANTNVIMSRINPALSTVFNKDLLDKMVLDTKVQETLKGKSKRQYKGRTYLNPLNQIDWDDEPTIFQAASIAHGHLLTFKQEWLPDGYSLGDILYSLPLAPGQKKQIAVLDWERRESAANSQFLDYEETLNNSLVRDRDINEIVKGTLNENVKANSSAHTGGIGFGLGGAVMGVFNGGTFGALLGISGGKSSSGSNANQNSHRDSTASSMQSINDRTVQSASVVRSQRATVIQTVSQGERVQATAESVANYNHCHAITIQYFEVLRHFTVHTRLAGVQECLFVPLQITSFDMAKCLRWRTILEGRVFRRDLLPGFDAIMRLLKEKENASNYYDTIGFPKKNYAEQPMKSFAGELFLNFSFFNTNEGRLSNDLINLLKVFGIQFDPQEFNDRYISNTELAERVGPRAIEFLLNAIVIETDKGTNLHLDLTLLNRFRPNATLQVAIRQTAQTPTNIRRDWVDAIQIRIDRTSLNAADKDSLEQFANKFMKIIVTSGGLRYQSDMMAADLFKGSINNDLFADSDSIYVRTPLNSDELRNPRGEDVAAANKLMHHLNENLEYYHKCIWFDMTPERRFMLLDGIIAPGKANGRSVASVVENKLIGIAGNSLIMPVAPGNQLDPTIDKDFDMFAQYFQEDNEPIRLSLPTKGVYAESVMGKCNACEEKDESRFWRWEESPIPDSPNTQILPLNTDTRRADPGNLQAKDFPAPIVNIQNAPAAPDPAGVQSMLQLLGKGDSFRDLTGLNQNQLNALATYQKNMDTAQAFGKEAAELAKAALKIDMIKDANKSGVLPTEDAKKSVKKELDPEEKSKTKKADDEQERENTEKDLKLIDDAKTQEQLEAEQAKELAEDRIRKGQGTTKATSGTPKKGKRKYDITLLFKNYEGRPLAGSFLVNLGSAVVDTAVEISGSSIFRTTAELDSSKDQFLEVKGNPGAPGTSSPDPDAYFHFGEFPVVLSSDKNVTIEIYQTRLTRTIEVAEGTSTSQVVEDAVAKEKSGGIGLEIPLKILTLSIEGSLTKTDTHTESSESGTSTSVTVSYTYKVPAPRLKIKQKGVASDDISLDE